MVAIDNIGFNKKEANLLRDMIGATIGTSREKVMLSFSHTHAAANVDVEKAYYDKLCQKICSAAERAKASMSEVSVGWDNVQADIGNNRRELLRITKKQPSLLSDWPYCSPTKWDSGQWSEPGVGVNFSLNGRPLSCCFWGVRLHIWDGFFAG